MNSTQRRRRRRRRNPASLRCLSNVVRFALRLFLPLVLV